MEIKGRLKWYLRWPIILNIIVAAMAIGVFVLDHQAGILMGVFFLVHLIFSIVVLLLFKTGHYRGADKFWAGIRSGAEETPS